MRYTEILEACWTGYQQQGMKKKGDRMVPNCVPVEEVKTGPEMTLNDLLYTAAAKAMHQAGLEGHPMDYEEAIKKAAKIYRIPYTPSELPKLLSQRAEIDRKLAMLKQGKQVAKARRQEKLAPTPAGAEEYWRTHALPTDRIKPPAKTLEETEAELAEDLRKWFKEKWVRFGPDGKIRGACARGSEKEGKPKCLPQSKAHALGKKGRASAAAKKRREDPNPERRGPAKNVATKVKENQIPPAGGRSPEQLERELLDRLGRRAGAAPGSNIDQVTNAYQQKILDRMGKRFGLPPGSSAEQVQAAQQAYLDKTDPRAAAQYRQNMANIDAGKTAQNKPVQLSPRYTTGVKEATGDDRFDSMMGRIADPAVAMARDKKFNTMMGRIVDPVAALKQDRVYEEQLEDYVFEFMNEFLTRMDQLGIEVWRDNPQAGEDLTNPKFEQAYQQASLKAVQKFMQRKKLDTNNQRLVAQVKADFDENADQTPSVAGFLGSFMQGFTTLRPGEIDILSKADMFKKPGQDVDEGRKIVPAETTIANAKKLWLYVQRNLVDLASNSEFDSKHNELFIDEKLNGLLKTASGQPVQVAFDQGGNIEFNNGILYIPIEAMYYYRGYMTSQKFVQDVVQALDQTQIAEKQDACYRKVKSRYKVWPSAYASGALVQCRKKGAANWGTGAKKK